VSEQITYYELQRITHEAKDLYQVTGDRASSSHKLLNLIQAVYDGQDQIKAHFGLVLSGDKLVDDINYRNHLCNLEPRALGGEMEGAGLSFTANENHVDWILVKGISDWADGSKKIDEHLHQPIAARNAVKLVIQALQVEQID
jgi:nucleoside phosphorylase